jgi:hypothetical protein
MSERVNEENRKYGSYIRYLHILYIYIVFVLSFLPLFSFSFLFIFFFFFFPVRKIWYVYALFIQMETASLTPSQRKINLHWDYAVFKLNKTDAMISISN